MTKHPGSRLDRLKLNEKKKSKISKEERASKVWRKLKREDLVEKEKSDELKEAVL